MMSARGMAGIFSLFFVLAWGHARGQEDMVGTNSTRPVMQEQATAYNPENSAYNPQNSPYNPDNSPYNPANSIYNYSNSPYNYNNSAYNPLNSPYNPDYNEYNPSRVTGAYVQNGTTYAVPRAGGGVNIFDKSGNLLGYSTASGEVVSLQDTSASAALHPVKATPANQAVQKPEDNATQQDHEDAQQNAAGWTEEDIVRERFKASGFFGDSQQ